MKAPFVPSAPAALALGLAACGDDIRKEVLACDNSLAAFEKQQGEDVLKLCARALEIGNLNARERIFVLFSRGTIHARRQEFDAAQADFAAIRQVDAGSAYAARGFAFIEATRQNHAGALDLYEEAIRLEPSNATLVGLRGGSKFGLGRYEEALADLAVSLDPPSSMRVDRFHDATRLRLTRGMALVELKRYADAVADLDDWIGKHPADPWGYIYRGILKVDTGRVRESIDDFDAAVRNGGPPAFVSGKLSELSGFFFGPGNASYDSGVKTALRALVRLNREHFPLTDEQRNERLQALFPDRVFTNNKLLFQLETGLAPLLMKKGSPPERAINNYYYGVLIGTLHQSGDPACQIVIRSLDEWAAGIAAARDVGAWMKGARSGGEFLAGAVVMGIATAVVGEIAKKDAIMLASRHGCGSDVTVNVLKNGATYLSWSLAL
jgi:tetratricopeptide (TPR) repeat protein